MSACVTECDEGWCLNVHGSLLFCACTKEHLQLAQERVANLDKSLQSMTTEKEDAMLRATTAEEQNAKMEKALSSASTRLDVSACAWVGWGYMHLHVQLCMCVYVCTCMID